MEGDGHGARVQEPVVLEVMFLPFLAPGHMNPMVETARLFAAHGVHVTIITTTQNAFRYQHLIDSDLKTGRHIKFHTLNLLTEYSSASQQSHSNSESPLLPANKVENFTSVATLQMAAELFRSMSKLQPQIEEFLLQSRPHCIISDMFFPWTSEIAHQLGIPRIVFHVCSYFALCCIQSVRRYYVPYDQHMDTTTKENRDDETYFLIPYIPDQIKMMRSQLPDHIRNPNGYTKMMDLISEAEQRSYGVIVNSLYDLEPAYAEHYTKIMGSKSWHIGPLFLSIKNHLNKSYDSDEETIINSTTDPNELKIMNWLNSQKPKSVLYVSFGSLTHFNSAQLMEIAAALEDAGHPFIWVVRKEEDTSKAPPSWLPEGYEERMKEKGIILRGWAPQMMILKHEATGGFVTHCGWNSTLESVTTGMPMVTWPLSSEQFYHEKLITKVLKVGVEVGVEEWRQLIQAENYFVKREKIERAVSLLMGNGEEAKEMRARAKKLGDMAKKAVQVGGSSHANLLDLIDELKASTK